jgi:hypothetical protein
MRRTLPWQLLALWLLFWRFRCSRSRSFSLLDTLRALGSSNFPAFPSIRALTFGLYTFQCSVDFRLEVVRVDRFRRFAPRCTGRRGIGFRCSWWFWWRVCFEEVFVVLREHGDVLAGKEDITRSFERRTPCSSPSLRLPLAYPFSRSESNTPHPSSSSYPTSTFASSSPLLQPPLPGRCYLRLPGGTLHL